MPPLTQNDEALLCGREVELRETITSIRADRLVVLASEPGVGLTSLLNAGIAPALKREGFIVTYFSDWQGKAFNTNLKEAIADAVREQAAPDFFSEGERLDTLSRRVRSRTGRHLVLLLDQFEDYVRCHTGTDISDSFDAELAQAIAGRDLRCVVAIQDHAVPAFERFGQHIPNLLGYQVRLGDISATAGRAAVIVEARALGMDVEPAVLDLLLASPVVARNVGRAHPFFLKVATAQLYAAGKSLRAPTLKASLITDGGGVDRLIMESLDSIINEFGTTHVELLFRWCNVLISPEIRRLAVTEKGLTDYAGKLNRFALTLLPLATAAGILRSVATHEAIRYEIARECLTPILRNWWERREAAAVSRRRAVFRTTSLSLALGAIVLAYIIWILLSKDGP